MKLPKIFYVAVYAIITALAVFDPADALAQSIPISETPLFSVSQQPPLMMMVMSRDEQLFNKAYPDYTDLDGNGQLDTTYNNAFEYTGYFDPNICYTYSSNQFAATSAATTHQCGGTWSGNFLNWVTMSRLDVLRSVFYGGYRSTDTTTTVLERANIPNDLHAWSKVYSGSDIGRYTPYSGTVSFCNATFSTGTPVVRVAQGAFTEWAATALSQCQWREEAYTSGGGSCTGASGNNSCYDDPAKAVALAGDTGLTVRVQVCGNATTRENFCTKYTDTSVTPNVNSWKPTGLLQQYGESGAMRFGLLTGSFSMPRSGGVLRRNIGKFARNSGTLNAEGCAAGDEVNTKNGRFCNQNAGNATPEGIVKTINALKLTNWSGSGWTDCNTYSILNRQGQQTNVTDRWLKNPGDTSAGGAGQNCSAWGNPLSEMYAEALRYISGEARTAGFNDLSHDLAGLPGPAWLDPYRSMATGGNPYCAQCSILVLSTGLNSFDSDEIPAVAALSRNAATSTQDVGTQEGISGNYLVGRIATGTPGDLAVGNSVATHTDLCTAKSVTDFSRVRGLCPDIPSMEGSYLLDGLAYDAWTTDLRPGLTSPDGTPRPNGYKNTAKTFAVSLAENLPKFTIPVGTGALKIAPLAQANNTGTAVATDGGWRSSFLGSVTIGKKQAASTLSPRYTYGRDLEADGSAGSFTWVWEDSLWGNDHDNDVVTMLTYCVGAKCTDSSGSGHYSGYSGKDICWRTVTTGLAASPVCGASGVPTVGANEVLIRIENLSAYAGNAMLTGYAITGSNADGLKRLTLRPGSADNSIITQTVNPPASWYAPMVLKYTVGTTTAKQLENPLFYAAKYGSFKDINGDGRPGASGTGSWDTLVPGVPDNFFAVTNPAKLKSELQKVFNQALTGSSDVGSAAASGARFVVGGSLAYQAKYFASDWTGDLSASTLNADGTLARPPKWLASTKLQPVAQTARNIFTAQPSGTPPTFSGTPFTEAGLTTAMKAQVMTGLNTTTFNITDVMAYLRGDQTKETNRTPPGPYRARTTKIGDILDSNPTVQFRTGYGYQNLPDTVGGIATGASTYATFVSGKSTDAVVYVGSNDGMLHAFNGTADATNGGKEIFAYVPNAVLSKIGRLTQPSYAHTYFVDGTPTLGDIYDGSGWRTLLIGATGPGARSVFGLDVTTPSAFTASKVLWEFNDQNDTDMGYGITVPGLPTIAANGTWISTFGNGYNSARNRAVLFVLNALNGSKIAAIDTLSGGSNTSTNCPNANGPTDCPNGLASAIVVDTDIDGTGDAIYAGDYLGNLWKFTCNPDTSPITVAHPVHTCTTAWQLGHNGVPLIQAQDDNGKRQPITAGVYAIHNPLGGTLVYFGTGKYLTTTDADPTNTTPINSIYAVWDSPYNTGTTLVRTNLMEQTITGVDSTNHTVSVSSNLFDYEPRFPTTGTNSKMGWYLDLDSSAIPGERVIAAPTAILGELLVNAFRPIGDVCLPGGINTFFELDLLSGAAALQALPGSGGGGGGGIPPGTGGEDLGHGPPLGSPNPVISIPGVPTVPGIGCPPGNPNCVVPHDWCPVGAAGYPNCAPPDWCPGGGNMGSANCIAPTGCTPLTPGFPYEGPCALAPAECKWFNPGTIVGNLIACRVSWRQLR